MRRSTLESRAIALAFFAILMTFALGLMEAHDPVPEMVQNPVRQMTGK